MMMIMTTKGCNGDDDLHCNGGEHYDKTLVLTELPTPTEIQKS